MLASDDSIAIILLMILIDQKELILTVWKETIRMQNKHVDISEQTRQNNIAPQN